MEFVVIAVDLTAVKRGKILKKKKKFKQFKQFRRLKSDTHNAGQRLNRCGNCYIRST